MPASDSHIPFIKTIHDFFAAYGLGKPFHSEIMCMRLEEQPDEKLMHMPLYRANFFRIIHFTKANLHFTSGEKHHDVVSNSVCFTYPGKMESWTRSERIYGTVIYFTAAFSGLDITRPDFDTDYPFFNFESELVLLLTEDEANELKLLSNEMIEEMYSNSVDKLDMIKKILHIYLHKIKRIYNKKINNLTVEEKKSKILFNRFRREVDDYIQQLTSQNKTTTPTVSLIAKQLFVNSNYLNSSIKNLTGKTASAHIQEKILLEAKSFLLHTDLQVSEIAFKLGFENTSYFNRFFKKSTNLTPTEYRREFVKR
jgi:AraC family transcriptional activator of pobA